MTKGIAEALVVTVRLLAEKSTEWNEQIYFLKIDLADACGAIRHDHLFRSLARRIGARAAVAIMRCIVGAHIRPRWMGLKGPEIHIGKVCRQGSPERPILWSVALDSRWPKSRCSGRWPAARSNCPAWCLRSGAAVCATMPTGQTG